MDDGHFCNVLKPFIDMDVLYGKETEYRQTLSVFAPIHDALDRSNLAPDEIDICLLVGGSCLIPQIKDGLSSFFAKANILSFDNPDDVQTVIARGAAINALSLALNNRPIIQPICQEIISIKTRTGTFDLIPQGVTLPWPPNGRFKKVAVLAVPESSDDEPVNLRIEIVSRADRMSQTLMAAIWEIPAPVRAGEKIQLECRFDANQVLKLRLTHLERNDVQPFKGKREHPFTHVISPQKIRLRIDETEERLRTGKVNHSQWTDTMVRLADDCAELKQYDKAMNRLSDIMRHNNQPSSWLLNKMAIYAGNMGDKKREEEIYNAAIEVDPDHGTSWFNLALLQQKQERLDEAKTSILRAIAIERNEFPYYVLQADIAKQQGKDFAVSEILAIADKYSRPLEEQNTWEIGWSLTAARLRGDQDKKQEIMELKKRKHPDAESIELPCEGCLPMIIEGTGS
jgi:Tfp pilus assembly protein PilF